MAMLSRAKSRVFQRIWSRTRIDQTSLGFNGGFWPINLPWFPKDIVCGYVADNPEQRSSDFCENSSTGECLSCRRLNTPLIVMLGYIHPGAHRVSS